jgi:hypothetical protein
MKMDGVRKMVNINGTTHAYSKPVETPNSLLLRTRFDSALVLLKPLLSDSDALSGTSLYRAMSQLHKTYPDLRGDEIEALVSEVIRSLQNRGGKH